MTSVLYKNMQDIPCNKGIIVDERKIYGLKDITPKESDRVELSDLNAGVIHSWHRKGHTLFQEEKGGLRHYVTSEAMVPCPFELQNGHCPHRFEAEHRKFNFHFTYASPLFVDSRPVCRYSLTNPNSLCWERCNGPHRNIFHHMD